MGEALLRRPAIGIDQAPGTRPEGGSALDAAWRAAYFVAYRLAHVYWFVRRPRVQGAYVIMRRPRADDSFDLLLLRNSYKDEYSPPCGGVDRGELPIEAALRELREEVGLVLEEPDLTPAGAVDLDLRWRHDRAHFFEHVLPRGANPPLRIDHREVVWADFVPSAEIGSLPLCAHLRVWLDEHAPWFSG